MKTLSCCRKFPALLCIAFAAAQTPSDAAIPGSSSTQNALIAAGGELRTVTLITGDRIVVGAATRAISIQPGEGRTKVSFSTQYRSSIDGKTEDVYVIPDDAVRLIATGKVDRELFNVTALVQSHYDDFSRDDLPLLMTYNRRSVAQRSSTSELSLLGATVGAQLKSVNATAVQVPKKQAPQLWQSLTAGAGIASSSRPVAALPSLSDSVQTVWLDRILQPALDRSVPQIGAPTAWAAGYTGQGVAVAVLDSGVDSQHPDLAGRIADSRNFTDEVDDDIVGHGTHVASIIAGSGAASNGQFRGVAPGAQIISGKVCFVFGCPLSTIIAGIEWAVLEKQAKVVNLSLGGSDSHQIDPVEAIINQFAVEHGTLFVVAAGNDLSEVGTPASADGALAVGAVDRNEQIASFSARGPRLGDRAIKPEITAPGVEIVAARAANTELGAPVGEHYVTLSGTSTATPHVAGAAAILIQRHPDWRAEQLRSALMGTAKSNPTLSLFDQGAGRVDVAAALNAKVVASSSALSLGTALWPHEDDEPVIRTVTYRNLTSQLLLLDLRVQMNGPGGGAAPAGSFRVTPATLIIPAGETREATVTANTRVAAADGFYTGTIAASDGGVSEQIIHSIPTAIEREVESYDLTLSHVNRQGQFTAGYFTSLIPLDVFRPTIPVDFVHGEVTVRLPSGRYALDSTIFEFVNQSVDASVLVIPGFTLAQNTSFTIDARAAQPVLLTHPVTEAQPDVTFVGEEHASTGGSTSGFLTILSGTSLLFTGNLGEPVSGFRSYVTRQWTATRIDTGGATHSEFYGATWVQNGTFFTGLVKTLNPETMATVHAQYSAVRPDLNHGELLVGPRPWDQYFGALVGVPVELPHKRTEFYTVSQEAGWVNLMTVEGPTGFVMSQSNPFTRYSAPRQHHSRWNEAPYAPPRNASARIADRTGDTLQFLIPLFGDSGGHNGFIPSNNSRLALFQHGEKLGEVTGNFGTFPVAPQPATYRLEASSSQNVMELSRAVKMAWTFRSAHIDGDTPATLPLLHVQLTPPLTARSEIAPGSVVRVPVLVSQDGRTHPPLVRDVMVEVSFNDGQSWKRVPVFFKDHRWTAVIAHPQQGDYVSLRTQVSDLLGNKVEQTLIRAYALAPPTIQ